ncbi:MAG TPA: hypothetical protein VGZ22_12300 [Isosphaeraceae bacterium]|jgi:hypothetical protein|nr:hypothetical protein [Isosphaeraceae bacterium]
MRFRHCCKLLSAVVVVTLPFGCSNAPPGEGFTNGPAPVYSPEKPAVRTDEPLPVIPDKDVLAGEKSADSGTGSNSAKSDAKDKTAKTPQP